MDKAASRVGDFSTLDFGLYSPYLLNFIIVFFSVFFSSFSFFFFGFELLAPGLVHLASKLISIFTPKQSLS